MLLNTRLRESELCSLDVSQYHPRGFHEVARKGRRVSKKVPVPAEAKDAVDAYLAERGHASSGPLFVSRYGNRIAAQEVARICERLYRQACAHPDDEEAFQPRPGNALSPFTSPSLIRQPGLAGSLYPWAVDRAIPARPKIVGQKR